MFSIVKKQINKKIKIIQLGIGDCYVEQADICLLKKISLDELFYIISKSSLLLILMVLVLILQKLLVQNL